MSNDKDSKMERKTYAPDTDALIRQVNIMAKIFRTSFLADISYASGFEVDFMAMYDVFKHTDQRRLHYSYYHGIDWDELKRIASVCYWMLRYKPIVRKHGLRSVSYKLDGIEPTNEAICEKFVMFIMLHVINKYRENHNLAKISLVAMPSKYKPSAPNDSHKETSLYSDIMYFFQNRPLTQESVLVLVESLAKAVDVRNDESCDDKA